MMEYPIKKMASLSGVSARTLRYYDEIGLLQPARINSSGYRIYGQAEVNRLQQILFYRELDLKLDEIKEILEQPDFNVEQALYEHQQKLLEKRNEIDRLLASVQQTLHHYKGEINMSDQQKFEAFKQQRVQENEEKYGKEIREKYGNETIEQANKKYLNLTEKDMQAMQNVEKDLFSKLAMYQKSPKLTRQLAQEIFQLHKDWLMYSWSSYSPEAHKGLGLMYVGDERFTSYYEQHGAGFAEALNAIIQNYA